MVCSAVNGPVELETTGEEIAIYHPPTTVSGRWGGLNAEKRTVVMQ